MSGPVVGIIVPCFNQGRFAAECVASLHAQTYRDWRAVVIDDASSDDSRAVLDSLRSDRVEIVHLKRNLGRALVRNEGLRRLGNVDYVLNVDCDDVLSPDYLQQLVSALEASPHSGLAYGTLHFFGALRTPGAQKWPTEPYEATTRYLVNTIPGPGVLFRTAALQQTDGWRAAFTHSSGEDHDIWLQVVEAGWDVRWVRDAVYRYRQHESSFLAQSTLWTQVEVQLNILTYHARGIRATTGMRAYLEPMIVPALLESIRRGRLRRLFRIVSVTMRKAPIATLTLVARHYAKQLRSRF